MKTSESISKIAPALLAAQKEITFAAKDATNPHFKSKYADLPTVIDAVKPSLNEAGIVFIQTASPSEHGYLAMTTRLLHTSGEWIEDTATLPLPKADPQGYGSASTYARRYGLAAICGLYQDDDDGQASQKQPDRPDSIKPITEQDRPLDIEKACAAIRDAETRAQAEFFAASAHKRAKTDKQHNAIIDTLTAYGDVA